MIEYKPLFPWFGGKSRIAQTVWQALGDVANYIEPFFGSGAVLFLRPDWHKGYVETVNDADGMVSNFWRAVQRDPDAVADYVDWPVIESDLHARHKWLIGQREQLTALLEQDPDYHDPKIAGWWAWGLCCWIGGEWCKTPSRKIPSLRGASRGIHRRRPHLNYDQGILVNSNDPRALIAWYSARLRRVRVCSGDWSRICGPSPTTKIGMTGVFLDPPYSGTAGRNNAIYAHEDLTVADDCRRWALDRGDDPMMRIVLCGYSGEHDELGNAGWRSIAWKAKGGYASQSGSQENARRERLWLSPHCLQPAQQLELLEQA